MATRTPNLSLIKPGPDDAVDVADLNENFDKIDNFAGGVGGDTYTKSEIDEMLNTKVDAEEGKGLSTNDFTDSDKLQISANKAGIGAVANVGAKNKLASTLDLTYLKSINRSGTWADNVYTLNSISFTVNADGTVLVNGTPSAQTVFLLITKARLAEDIAAGNYTLSGCPFGGGESGSNYRIFAYNPSSTVNGATDIGNGVEVHCDYSHSKDANIAIVVGANKTVNNLTFSPMLRDAAIEDDSYVPYGMTNAELTKTKADRSEVAIVANSGSKNRLNYDSWAAQVGVTRGTKVVDGNSITITATSADATTYWAAGTEYDFPSNCRIPVAEGEKYIMTWESDSTDTNRGRIYLFPNGNTSGSVNALASEGRVEITAPSGCTFLTFRLGVSTANTSITYSNLMICPKVLYDIDNTYQPYAPTNRELYEMIMALQSGT